MLDAALTRRLVHSLPPLPRTTRLAGVALGVAIGLVKPPVFPALAIGATVNMAVSVNSRSVLWVSL